jgi:hypothetical protein
MRIIVEGKIAVCYSYIYYTIFKEYIQGYALLNMAKTFSRLEFYARLDKQDLKIALYELSAIMKKVH